MSHDQSIKGHETGLAASAPEPELTMPGPSANRSAHDLAARIAEAYLRLATENNVASLATEATEQLRHLLEADRVLLVRASTPEMGLIENESVLGEAKLLSGLHCELKYLFPFERLPKEGQTYWLSSIESGACFRIDPSTGSPMEDGPTQCGSCNPFHLLVMNNLGHSAAIHFFSPSERAVPTLLSCYFKEAYPISRETLKNAQLFVQWLLNRLEELNAIKTCEEETRLRSVRLDIGSEAPEKYADIWEQFESIAPSLLAHMTGCGLTLLGPARMHALGQRLNESSRDLLYKWLEHQKEEQKTPLFCQGSRELDPFWPSWAESMTAFPVSSGLDRLWLILFQPKPQGFVLQPLNQSELKRTETAPAIGPITPLKLPVSWSDAIIEHLRESAAYLGNSRTLRQRLLSESRLRLSEARREAIIASIPEIIAMVDAQCICQDVHVPLGFAHPLIDKNCLGLSLAQILPERYREKFVEKFEAALNQGEAGRVVVSLSKAKATLHYELSLARSGASEVIISVREQTKLIESLKRNELLSLVAQRAHSAIILTDPEKRIHWVNAAFEELSGYSEAELLGCTPSMLQGEETDSATIARINQGLREEIPVRETILNYAKDGSKYWVRLEISPYYKKDGSLEGFSGVQVDVSELVAQREMLEQSQQELSLIYENSPVGLLLKDAGGRWLRANQEFLKQVGLSNYPWQGKTNAEISVDQPKLAQLLSNCQRSDARTWEQRLPLMVEEKVGLPSSEHLYFEVRKCPLYDNEGNARGIILVSQDITERKRAESQVLQSAKREAIEQMAGGIAHDFNNHLASIGLSTDLILRDPLLSEKTSKLVQTIRREAQAANHVARQLLAFTKLHPLHVERVAIKPFLEECLSISLMGSATSHSVDLENPRLSFPTDPNLLFQVFTNLILNARQAQENKGHISISALETDNGSLRLSIADQGPGITDEEMDRIFDAYYSTKATGSGLGLHVVSAVLSRLGGTIELDKSYQNGARFILLIPPLEVSETNNLKSDSTEAEPTPSHHTATKILLLEDEPNQVALLSAFFDSLDLEYACFSDGKQLLEEVESVEEAGREQLCCLLDITVTTGLGGLEILQPLREAAPQARIILVSGYSNQWESNAELFKKSNALFLPKPYSFDELKNKMNES